MTFSQRLGGGAGSACRFDFDGPRLSLFSSGDGQLEHPICQASLNLI